MGELLNTFKQTIKPRKKSGIYYQLRSALPTGDWEEYPRPQLKRDSYLPLNGIWKIREKTEEKTIKVPFAPQSALSGYATDDIAKIPEELLYERSFVLPADFIPERGRVLLHFGAVDQKAQVFVNNRPMGTHEGGYLPFHFDITDFLKPAGEENIINVLVEDHLDHRYPWGKQKKDRGGMWYTPVSGIWQTVWLEAVPEFYIRDIKISENGAGGVILRYNTQPLNKSFHAELSRINAESIAKFGTAGRRIRQQLDAKGEKQSVKLTLDLPNGKKYEKTIRANRNEDIAIDMNAISMELCGEEPKLWSPADPYLYTFTLQYGKDIVTSYFGLRTIGIREVNKQKRICLNNKPIFLHGVLDQGYYSDGLFLPAAPEGFLGDIQGMQEMGFNLLRKHIKVEPELFYYYCDRYGMLVMQDMINNGGYDFIMDTGLPTLGYKIKPETKYKSGSKAEKARQEFFVKHSLELMDHLHNHPSLIAYTVFNEGWGQFGSREVGDLLRAHDPSRLYDYTSGWFDHGGSDFESIHEYFHPQVFEAKDKPVFLSECGGFTWQVPGHSYTEQDSYGYGSCTSSKELTDRIIEMYETMVIPSIPKGMCGCIYTQVSDVEDEVNGFYTYDRRICKPDVQRMRELAEKLGNALGTSLLS